MPRKETLAYLFIGGPYVIAGIPTLADRTVGDLLKDRLADDFRQTSERLARRGEQLLHTFELIVGTDNFQSLLAGLRLSERMEPALKRIKSVALLREQSLEFAELLLRLF